jgi:hypothetical protein
MGLVLAFCGVIACSTERRAGTEVLLEIDAEEQVQDRLASLQVDIRGGGPDDAYADYTGDDSPPLTNPTFPLHVGLMPRSHDAQRRYLVTVTAYDDAGGVVAQARLAGGYVAGALRFARIVLEDSCYRHKSCESAEEARTCRQGTCVEAVLSPESLSEDPKHPTQVPAGAPEPEEPDAAPVVPAVDGGSSDASDAALDAGDSAADASTDAPQCVGVCRPGQQEMQPCGNCGTRARTCSETCEWGAYGSCEHVGMCKPGEKEERACGNCGMASYVCSDSCGWAQVSSCSGSGECPANVSESEPCGNCGQRTRSCGASCGWGQYGSCAGEGPCAPGAVTTQPCGKCGTQSRTCAASCSWPSYGECTNQGVCTPGEDRPCNSGVTNCSMGIQTCSASCGWGACRPRSCTPFIVLAQGDNNAPFGCGPNCCNGTSCSWVVGATCPAGTHRYTFTAGNPGQRGTCTAGWLNGNDNDPSCVLSSHVGGTDGTHCSITIQCVGVEY